SGGLGRLYKVTSNSWESTGDGIALAFRIGATLRDMEMVQFHPTGMVWPPGVKGLLVTESVRGEGGILLNAKGERFMLRYSPVKKELDARDVVARAIYNEIENGNGTAHKAVYLDITNKGAAFIKKKLPAMYEQFKEFAGVDITKEKMEVAPTVHYFMGGIKVDAETCRTNVLGLYSCGEAAGGLHGANRLGGNSLADILVFGRRAGLDAARYSESVELERISMDEINREISRMKSYLNEDAASPYPLMEELRETMSEKVGIMRNEKALREALNKITELKERSKAIGVKGGIKFNQGFMTCFELDNMLTLAECLVMSAIERKESRGAHTRSDYPKKDPNYKLNILCKLQNGNVVLDKEQIPEMPEYLKSIVKDEVY
ncbi:MAG: FAD-binding protein, partial [Candidatus Micrarchaeaceae archaeon]